MPKSCSSYISGVFSVTLREEDFATDLSLIMLRPLFDTASFIVHKTPFIYLVTISRFPTSVTLSVEHSLFV